MASSTIQTTLTSSNRSGRLKYANAQDLPSFPSIGLKDDGAAASTAATLGWANQKSPGLWKPDSISNSASTAALLANDRMASVNNSQPGPSSAGSQAAVMAASSARRRQHNQSSPPSLWGASAANLAFNASRSPKQLSPTLGTATLNRQGSMRAAKGAMAGARPRSMSSPQPPKETYPDQANAASNALSAATIAHRPSMRAMNSPVGDAGAVPYTTMNRQMFTSHPPVKPETDEQKRNDILHASAVAMAKRMYDQQQKAPHQPLARGRASSFTRHGEGDPSGLTEEEPIPIVYGNLQEAAYRLAQERLAKLQDQHQKNRDLQEYYGATGPQRQGKLGTIRNKLTRKRSSSDGDLMMEDQKRSQQIRKQMSLFNTKLMEVDEQKRTKDREALLAAAQRNVQARLKDMDDKIQADTGVVPATKKSDWDWKAHAAAQARFDASHGQNHGKIDLGGGKFMDREEVDQIAAKKVQPLLDEMNKNAEREYERRAQQKAEEEKQKEEDEKKRAREKEVQAIHKKLKDQQKDEEKIRKAEIKNLEKKQKEQAKAAKADQKRLGRDGKQKEKEVVVAPVGTTTGDPVAKPEETKAPEPEPEKTPEIGHGLSRALSIKFHKGHHLSKHKEPKGKEVATTPAQAPAPADEKSHGKAGVDHDGAEPPSSPTANPNKVKTWFRSHFHKRSRSKSNLSGGEEEGTSLSPKEKENDKGLVDGTRGGFIGGAALTRLSQGSSGSGSENTGTGKPSVIASSKTEGDESGDRRDSMRELALAGRTYNHGHEAGEGSAGNSKTVVVAPTPIPITTPSPVTTLEQTTSLSPPPQHRPNPEPTTTTSSTTSPPINTDGISPYTESEPASPPLLKAHEMSAVEKFGLNNWDTATPPPSHRIPPKRTESVSSLGSTDLSDSDDDDDISQTSLEKFETTRDELDKPTQPPRVADSIGEESILARPRPIPRDKDGVGNVVGVGGARATARETSPGYRGSRFSENFEEEEELRVGMI